MIRRLPLLILALLATAGATFTGARTSFATEVWSGRTFAFSKAAYGDFNSPANQDQITSHVWLTRANTQGLFNYAQELSSGGTLGDSPLDTEWAMGDAADHASLVFQRWVDWAGQLPTGTIGKYACVHLVSDDIYIDIVFDSWASGSLGGGAFSYHRAVKPTATATSGNTWGRLKALYR